MSCASSMGVAAASVMPLLSLITCGLDEIVHQASRYDLILIRIIRGMATRSKHTSVK